MKKETDYLFIDTLLMSCRVLKRGMEEFIFNSIATIAKELGYSNAAVVRTMASRCKSKFRDKFKSIYDSFKKDL